MHNHVIIFTERNKMIKKYPIYPYKSQKKSPVCNASKKIKIIQVLIYRKGNSGNFQINCTI